MKSGGNQTYYKRSTKKFDQNATSHLLPGAYPALETVTIKPEIGLSFKKQSFPS